MSDNNSTTATAFALTNARACSVTLITGENSITWQALDDDGGQTTCIVPKGTEIKLSDPEAILTRIPFEYALGAGQRAGGMMHIADKIHQQAGTAPTLTLRNNTWCSVSPDTQEISITPHAGDKVALSMQLLFSPAADVLSPATFFSGAEWLYKAPVMPAGYTYVITLAQFPIDGQPRVFLNLSAVIPNTAA